MFPTSLPFPFRRFLGAGRPARRAEGAVAGRFEHLVEQHLDAIYRTARRLGVREVDIDDLVQEVLVVMARRLDDIEVDKERAFALGTTARVAAGFRRKAHRRLEALVPEVDDEPSRTGGLAARPPASGEERLLYAEALDVLRIGLAAMTEPQRVTFVLFELEELRASEIANELGIAEAAVVSRLHRARAVLRRVCERRYVAAPESCPELAGESQT
jgi:RNA polymerase sigma-70 factor (ECF subfamily)